MVMQMQPGQYTAYPYVPAQTNGISDMLSAIMPIIMIVMLMAMIMPMMKGVTAGA